MRTWNDCARRWLVELDDTIESVPLDVDHIARHAWDLADSVRLRLDPPMRAFDSVGQLAAYALHAENLWNVEAMTALLCMKHHDYGTGNINAFGHVGVAVRINDKVARLRNLRHKMPAVQNEATTDTLMDLVGYSIIASMLDAGEFNLKLVDHVN